MLKLKMILRDDTLVVVGCTSKSSLSVSAKPPRPPAWIMQPLTGRHRRTDYFTLRERLITMQTTGRNPEVY